MPSFVNHTFNTNEVVTAATLQAFQSSIDAVFPIGSYLMVHMTPPASGTLVNGAWLPCDGAAVAQSSYVTLFNTIGFTYGNPGGGNFSLPDFRGRSPLSAASGGTADATLGRTDGAALASRRPKHSHSVSDTHSHGISSGGSSGPSAQHTHVIPSPTALTSASQRGSISRLYGGGQSGTFTDTGSANHYHSVSGSTTSNASAVTAVGSAGLTDGPSYLVCCTVLVRAL